MRVQDSRGIRIELGEAIKRGGEARIFEVRGKSNLVAKVYHEHRAEREAKLKAMLANAPVQPATHTAIAWPMELLYERGQLVGFLMPKISGYDPIMRFYNPALRKKQLPGFDWRYLHRTASNLAVVIETVHEAGHLIGDLNESNILVNDQALVTLVDADSFQIAGQRGQIFRCAVGKPEYTPPELHRVSFQLVNRRPEHDHFGLAVLFFQLLMQGYHPFSGVLPAHLSIGRVDVYGIKNGLFPYYQNHKQSSVEKPPNAPPFALLHPELQALFIRCFVDGHRSPTQRPTAREWRALLYKAEQALVTCERDRTHIYGTHLAGCPFCAPEQAIQKPLPPALQKAIPSLSATSGQASSSAAHSPATFISISMQSLGQLLPNRSRSVLKLVWNVILIATVAITWLRISGLAIRPESQAITQPPTSVAVVEPTKTASPQPPTSVAVVEPTKSVATHTKTASPQPPTKTIVVEPTKSASPQPQTSVAVVEHTTIKPTVSPTIGEGSVAGGMACFGSFGFGVTCLDDALAANAESGWTSFSEDNSSLGGDLIHDMATCPDSEAKAANTLLIAHTSGISAFDGQTWAEYENQWGYTSADGMACDADGGIWVAHYQGVSYFDGQRWSTTPSKQLATGDDANDLMKDVALAPDGQVWVATAHTIATTSDGNEWTVYQQGQGFDEQYFLSSVVVDHQGEVWAAYSGGLLHFDGTNWTSHENSDLFSIETLTVDDDGKVWVGTFSYGLKLFNGRNWVTYDRQNSGLMSNYVRSLAVDAQGRLWAGTEWGISVFDGTNWQTYQMDSADLVDNDIRTLAVIGGGPALPEASDKKNGALSGQLLDRDKKPIAGATVEICIKYSEYGARRPCKGQPLTLQATSDADGNFLITDIPVGRIVVTVNIAPDKWVQPKNHRDFRKERILINAGEETKLYRLTIDSE
ncbi:MAG: two-component regulator propeller domain-containing protein [Ardenticatenaceae bacterium]